MFIVLILTESIMELKEEMLFIQFGGVAMRNGFIHGRRDRFYYKGKQYDTLFTFDIEKKETKETVIAYTANEYDEEGNISIFASYLIEKGDTIELDDDLSETELEGTDRILNLIQILTRKGFEIDDINRLLDPLLETIWPKEDYDD